MGLPIFNSLLITICQKYMYMIKRLIHGLSMSSLDPYQTSTASQTDVDISRWLRPIKWNHFFSSFDSSVLTNIAATEHIAFWQLKYAKQNILFIWKWNLCFILQFSEKVNLHFLGLMEALRECNSLVLAKVFYNTSNLPLFYILTWTYM